MRSKRALIAFWAAGNADAAAVVNQPVREVDPLGLWQQGHQILFDPFGARRLGQAEQRRDPFDMRVHDDTTRNTERRPEQHVGRFATDARKGCQFGEGPRQFSVVMLNQSRSHADQIGRFGSEKAGRMHDLFHVRLLRYGESLRSRPATKQFGVTKLTRSSVHWAERIVAASN